MPIGPIQLLVVGFDEANFTGEVQAELDRLRDSDVVRVIDMLVVHKQADGTLEHIRRSDLTGDDKVEFGATVGALIGTAWPARKGAEIGAIAGAEAATKEPVEPPKARGTWTTRSRSGRPPPSCCSSTAGRSRCASRSSARAATACWRISGSTAPISSTSASWPPRSWTCSSGRSSGLHRRCARGRPARDSRGSPGGIQRSPSDGADGRRDEDGDRDDDQVRDEGEGHADEPVALARGRELVRQVELAGERREADRGKASGGPSAGATPADPPGGSAYGVKSQSPWNTTIDDARDERCRRCADERAHGHTSDSHHDAPTHARPRKRPRPALGSRQAARRCGRAAARS